MALPLSHPLSLMKVQNYAIKRTEDHFYFAKSSTCLREFMCIISRAFNCPHRQLSLYPRRTDHVEWRRCKSLVKWFYANMHYLEEISRAVLPPEMLVAHGKQASRFVSFGKLREDNASQKKLGNFQTLCKIKNSEKLEKLTKLLGLFLILVWSLQLRYCLARHCWDFSRHFYFP